MSTKSAYDIHNKRQKLGVASLENHAKYINCDTGLFDNKYLTYRSCPVCNSENNILMFNKDGGSYVKCSQCAMVFLNPLLRDNYLSQHYADNHAEQSAIVNEDLDFYRSIYLQGIKSIKSCCNKKDDLLDFGCSSGIFLDIAKDNNFHTTGIELNVSEAMECEKKGHKVYNKEFDKIEFNKAFDIITLWDVFEHLPDGLLFLKKFYKILALDGLVFLQIPSSNSIVARIMQEKCNMFDGLEHVNLYSPDTIKMLAEKAGFSVLIMNTVIPEVKVLNSYLNYEDPYMSKTVMDENKTLFGMDAKEILSTLQGYKIQCVLQKKIVKKW